MAGFGSTGVAIITCDRPDFFWKCLKSIEDAGWVEIFVVDDGNNKIDKTLLHPLIQYITTPKPRSGVGVAKSMAIDAMLNFTDSHDRTLTDLFLIEDDMVIKDTSVFLKYEHASRVTGIRHFMFGYHGPANKTGSYGSPLCKHKFDYPGNTRIVLNQHCVGSFCYYHRKCFEEVGNFDLTYNNAFEHIDHSYMLAKAGLTTPYWNWADIGNSWELIGEQACSEESSAIRGQADWRPNIEAGFNHFVKKHGVSPYEVPDTSQEEIIKQLKRIHDKHRYLR